MTRINLFYHDRMDIHHEIKQKKFGHRESVSKLSTLIHAEEERMDE